MRILIASTFVPFIDGGGRMIVRDLQTMLSRAGHEVDVLWLPFHSDWRELPEQMLALRLTDVSSAADLLITIRPPAHLLRHPNKVLWFIHHYRTAYDLWGTEYQDIPSSPMGRRLRQAIIDADNQGFAEARRIFTNSVVVADRLRRFNQVGSEVLYPPLLDPDRFRTGPFGDYVFYPSRLAYNKRQWLAIRAMDHVSSAARLVVAGAPDSPADLHRLSALSTSERVTLIPRWISEEEKIELMAGSRAVVYVPFDEDSYGYPSLEACHSHKPIITCSDSGGTLELVQDGRQGLVTEPRPASLARAIDRLFADPGLAPRMGDAAAHRLDELDISWERVVSAFTTATPGR